MAGTVDSYGVDIDKGCVTEAFLDQFPMCRPRLRVFGWGVWFFDDRWRLPYRWYEWKRYPHGVAVMAAGAAVMVSRIHKLQVRQG